MEETGEVKPNHVLISENEPERIDQLKIYIDGASRSNPGPSSIAVIVVHPEPSQDMSHSEKIGKKTNNEAEFYALKKAIELCAENGWEDPMIFTDSRLVANVVIGKWRVRSPSIQKIVEEISELIMDTRKHLNGYFKPYIVWVPRTDPMIIEADKLCNEELNKIF
jgi:ribonuclease HI